MNLRTSLLLLTMLAAFSFFTGVAQLVGPRAPAFLAATRQVYPCNTIDPSWTDPSGANTLYSWWVASDRCTNVAITSGSSWSNRVASTPSIAYSIDANPSDPTNQATGVYMVLNQWMPNDPPATPGTNSTVALVFAPESFPGASKIALIWSPYNASDVVQGVTETSGGFWLNGTSGISWGSFSGFSACFHQIGTGFTAQTYDLTGVYSNGVWYFYTNGIFATLKACTKNTPPPWRLLSDPEPTSNHPGFNGRYRELVQWSNILSPSQVLQFHQYATNRYGYSP